MSKIHWAVEVETGAVTSHTSYGMTYGYLRYITDRPLYTGTDTGAATVPVGDNSVIKINISGAETFSAAMQSGQLYAASNGTFKTANTVLAVGERFTVIDNSEFSGGTVLATAKGSAPSEGDMFEITNNGSGTEALVYAGINKWYEDWITRDGMSNPSRRVDLEGTGDYGTLSGFTFTVKNTIITASATPLWRWLYDSAINLCGKKVRVYCIIDDVFYQVWAGVVDNAPMDETNNQIICKDNHKSIHKDLPPVVVEDEYSNVPDSAKGKSVPICIGDIEYANIVNLFGNPVYYDLVRYDGRNFKIAQATTYTEGATIYLTLCTPDKSFAVNYFAGKYLYVDSGGDTTQVIGGVTVGGEPDTDSGVEILASDVSSYDYSLLSYTVRLTLAEPVQNFILATHGNAGTAGVQSRWNFKIANIIVLGVISDNNITSFKTDLNGVKQLFYYDSNSKYRNISGIIKSSTLQTITYVAPRLKEDGTIDYYYRIPITAITLLSSPTGKPITGTLADMIDVSRATYVSWPENTGGVEQILQIVFYLSEDERDLEEMFIGTDIQLYKYGFPTATGYFSIYITALDQYGKSGAGDFAFYYPNSLATTTIGSFNSMPNDYYKFGAAGAANLEHSNFFKTIVRGAITYNIKDLLQVGDRMLASIKSGQFKFNIGLYAYTTAGDRTVRLKELAVFAKRQIDISGNALYTRVSGEQIGGVNANTVYKAFRLMLEGTSYDNISSSLIDYGNLSTTRDNWYVGRQLTERQNTVDYIQELCEQSFVCAFQNRKGKLAFSAWRDRLLYGGETPLAHNNTMIVRDSISGYELTSIDRVFDSFTVNYSFDPGGNKYFSSYQIKNVDSPSGSPGGVLGALWSVCRACYIVYKMVKEYKIDLSWFNDRARWFNSGETGDGLGVDGSAYRWLTLAAYWLSRQKRNIEYDLPINTTNILAELCAPVAFKDPVFTNSEVYTDAIAGSIFLVEYDVQGDKIHIGTILDPSDTIDTDYGDIVETGSATDISTESGSRADSVIEDGS